MSARAWQAILSSWSTMNTTISAVLPSGQGSGLEAKLDGLRDDLMGNISRLITRLRSVLTSEARQKLGLSDGSVPATSQNVDANEASALATRDADDEVQQMIEPIAMHLDERVLGRLPPRVSPSWIRLQEDVIQSDDGGDVFFRKLDALLDSPHPSPLVLEVYLFCLNEGFFGQYLDEPENVVRYKERIAKRLPPPSAPLATTSSGKTDELSTQKAPRVLPAAVYYVAAAVIAIVLIWILRALVG